MLWARGARCYKTDEWRSSNASPKKENWSPLCKSVTIPDASDAQRKQLNNALRRRMKQLMLEYPDDNDIKALYIDAVMLIHAWNFWNPDGTPQPWTPELVTLSEGILKMIRAIPAHCIIISMLQKRRVIQWWRCQVPTRSKFISRCGAYDPYVESHEYEKIRFVCIRCWGEWKGWCWPRKL